LGGSEAFPWLLLCVWDEGSLLRLDDEGPPILQYT